MDNFICKIASREDLLKRWDYLVTSHKENKDWEMYKERAIKNFDNGNTITYLGFLNDEIICEATAYIKEEAFVGDIEETDQLLSDTLVYLSGFRTNKEYEGKGFFSKLYNYMEDDLYKRGYTELCLGVKARNVRNTEIYFHLGFREYIKSIVEYDPVQGYEKQQQMVVINYYKKIIDINN